jgi:zinc/manganese transport system ATP-binding protein
MQADQATSAPLRKPGSLSIWDRESYPSSMRSGNFAAGVKSYLGKLGEGLRAPFDWFDGGYSPQVLAAPERFAAAGIELERVSAGYAGRLAIMNVTARFAPGSLTAVVGPNGAGKSSLLKAIAGNLPLRSGTIRCAACSSRDFAYLPQQAELDRTFPIDVRDLVALGAWRSFGAYRRPHDGVFDHVAEAAATAGLEGFLERPVERLSVGEFQRALFARLLMQDAAMMLLDEPFAAVDDRTTEDLLRLIRNWHEDGRTVIAVLHDLDQVREHFPTTLLLAQSCVGWGDSASVLAEENLTRARKMMERSVVGTVPA